MKVKQLKFDDLILFEKGVKDLSCSLTKNLQLSFNISMNIQLKNSNLI